MRVMGTAMGVLCIAWGAVMLMTTYYGYHLGVAALRSNSCEIAEGTVTKFVPAPISGHADETFVVAGHGFSYSDYEIMPGFHTTVSHGGPIRAGAYVRVFYVKKTIVRLEIATLNNTILH